MIRGLATFAVRPNAKLSMTNTPARNLAASLNSASVNLSAALCKEDFDSNGELSSPEALALNSALDGVLCAACKDSGFSGEKDSMMEFVLNGKRVLLNGVGSMSCLETHTASSFGKRTAAFLTRGTFIDRKSVIYSPLFDKNHLHSVVSNIFVNSKLNETQKLIKIATWESITCELISNHPELDLEIPMALAAGVSLTKDIVEAPPNVANPSYFASIATDLGREFPSLLKTDILERSECEALGMGLFLGVSRGSSTPPKFIHIRYSCGKPRKRIAIVGKGVTFDSGGYNLKVGPGSLIELMKFDCGGAAAVLGTAKSLALLRPNNLQVDFYIAACENMISGEALRPGDVISASNGVTVEVNNTDAEGRLTLADAILIAQDRENLDQLIDIATLTGACIVALGDKVGGLYS